MNGSKVCNHAPAPQDLAAGEYYGRIACKRELGGFILSEIHHPNRRRLPEHSHRAAYFSLLLDGAYSETFAGRRHDYEPLTIWWHRPGIVHQDAVGDRGGRFFNVELAPAGPPAQAGELGFRGDYAESQTRLVWLAVRLLGEFRRWQPCSALAAESLALEMTALSLRGREPRFGRQPDWLGRVLQALNDDCARRHTAAELGAVAGVHPVHLASVFRQSFHESIGDHLRAIRARRAAVLLGRTRLPLAEIAARLGFADQSHFTRSFRRVVGMPPGAFRAVIGARPA